METIQGLPGGNRMWKVLFGEEDKIGSITRIELYLNNLAEAKDGLREFANGDGGVPSIGRDVMERFLELCEGLEETGNIGDVRPVLEAIEAYRAFVQKTFSGALGATLKLRPGEAWITSAGGRSVGYQRRSWEGGRVVVRFSAPGGSFLQAHRFLWAFGFHEEANRLGASAPG